MMRKPITIQYPDKTPKPVKEMLPERYRGFLEVDINICTACLLCMKACPIECIYIEVGKDKEGKRGMSSFAIDVGKCMYCGLCCEPCPTGAIRHTPLFENAVENFDALLFQFIKKGDFIIPFKAKKDVEIITHSKGKIVEEIIMKKGEG